MNTKTRQRFYVIRYNNDVTLCQRDGVWLYWGTSRTTHCRWGNDLKVLKVYYSNEDNIHDLWIRMYRDFPIISSEPKKSAGWIAPDGKFFSCSSYGHDDVACGLSVQYYGDIDGTQILEDKNWLRLYMDGGVYRKGSYDDPITQQQIDTLFDLSKVDKKWKDKIISFINRSEY